MGDFLHLKEHLSADTFMIALIMLWKTWELRNKEVHGSVEGFPYDLVRWAKEFLTTYQEAQTK